MNTWIIQGRLVGYDRRAASQELAVRAAMVGEGCERALVIYFYIARKI